MRSYTRIGDGRMVDSHDCPGAPQHYVKLEVAQRLLAELEKIWNDGACHDIATVGEALDYADDN